MAALANTPVNELQAVLGRYDHEIDEPDTIRFMAMANGRMCCSGLMTRWFF